MQPGNGISFRGRQIVGMGIKFPGRSGFFCDTSNILACFHSCRTKLSVIAVGEDFNDASAVAGMLAISSTLFTSPMELPRRFRFGVELNVKPFFANFTPRLLSPLPPLHTCLRCLVKNCETGCFARADKPD